MSAIKELHLKGLLLISPKIFTDARGYFFESFNAKELSAVGLNETFVQDNESFSNKFVLRGLHFQNPPYAQGKLVRVVAGSVRDVVVDIRKDSPTYKQHFTVVLTAQNKKTLYIPPGFAHGFITLEDATVFQYKCTNYWNKEAESGIIWNDSELNIDWGCRAPILSDKDLAMPILKSSLNLF